MKNKPNIELTSVSLVVAGDTVTLDLHGRDATILIRDVANAGPLIILHKAIYDRAEAAEKQVNWMRGRWMWRLAIWFVRRGF